MAKTKKSLKGLGARYGIKLRKQYTQIHFQLKEKRACPECGSKMDKMYTEEELDKLYPVKSMFDQVNLKNRTDMMRFRKCSSCGHVMQLSLKQIMEGLKKVL